MEIRFSHILPDLRPLDPSFHVLNSTQLLLDLQHVNAIAQQMSGTLEPHEIASHVTNGLVELFDCAFARIWLVEPSQTHLKLVASAGLYTHTDGSFARVPMGAYKVGKIAQNRVPFLSHQLAEEAWVKDREWAIANGIKGFAGYPLAVGDRVTGVLAAFSRHPMNPEFLEALQVLCMATTIALDAAQTLAHMRQSLESNRRSITPSNALSDQLSETLTSTRLVLVGTEQPLLPSVSYTFLKLTEVLAHLRCSYCRLTYDSAQATLEAIAALPTDWDKASHLNDPVKQPSYHSSHLSNHSSGLRDVSPSPAVIYADSPLLPESSLTASPNLLSQFQNIQFVATCGGGSLTVTAEAQGSILKVQLQMPYITASSDVTVNIQCQRPVLQLALTHLAFEAGLNVCGREDDVAIAITDREDVLNRATQVIWVRYLPNEPVPPTAQGVLDLSIQAAELATLVHQVSQGDVPPASAPNLTTPSLSNREQEIIALLAQGLRDRDIAQRLYISESTVKFHLNNSQTKLSAKNRYEAVYKAAIQGII